MVRAARQIIKEAEGDVDSSLADDIERGILELQTAMASGHNQEVKSRTEELEKWVTALYRETKEKKR